MLKPYSVILLDMNRTFMFDEARFSPEQDYYLIYKWLEGDGLLPEQVNGYISGCYEKIIDAYNDPSRQESFPQVRDILAELDAPPAQFDFLEGTFAHYEQGHVPSDHAALLRKLSQSKRLGLVSNLWAPQSYWQDYLMATGLWNLFDVLVFSSDHSVVKPSPKLFQLALNSLQVDPSEVVHISASYSRDVCGARAAGIDCIWLQHEQQLPPGGAPPTLILKDLLELAEHLE